MKKPANSPTPQVCFYLFGPFQCLVRDTPLPPLPTRRESQLLALLLLNPRGESERDWLAVTIWPDSMLSQARAYLRISLTRLRHALGKEAYRLQSPTPRTLRLDLTDAFVDLHQFDKLIKLATEESIEQAVSLYKGKLVDGWEEIWLYPDRERVAQDVLAGLDKLANSEMEGGNPSRSAVYLRKAIALDGLRESSVRALMQALAKLGDFGAALLEYERLCKRLENHQPAKPSPETTALFDTIRYEQRRAAGASLPKTEIVALPQFLPVPITKLIGRECEIEAALSCLKKSRLVTLTGSGGVGKTRLALAVAQEVKEQYTEGALFIDFSTVVDSPMLWQTLARALNIGSEQDARSKVLSMLKNREALLVMDNCEQVLTDCAQLISELLSTSGGLSILATSREAFGIVGEQVWRVPSLSVPPVRQKADGHGTAELLRYESVRLFIERAELANPGFESTSETVEAVARICSFLDGIPLAIELAAARVRTMNVFRIEVRLEDMFTVLHSGNRGALPRHQTLQATIQWSYDLLSESEKLLLSRVGLFVGGWTLEACREIDSGGSVTEDEIEELLSALCDKSLVVYDQIKDRYHLLESVRQFSLSQLHLNPADEETVSSQFRMYYRNLVDRTSKLISTVETEKSLSTLELEYDNIRSVLDSSIKLNSTSSIADSLMLCKNLAVYWDLRGNLTEGRGWMVKVLECDMSMQEDKIIQGGVLRSLATFAARQGNNEEARRLYSKALEFFKESNHRHGIAQCMHGIGNLALYSSKPDEAFPFFVEAKTIYNDLGMRADEAGCLLNMANVKHYQHHYETAYQLTGEALDLYISLGYSTGVATCKGNMAWSAIALGKLHDARTLLHDALEGYHKLKLLNFSVDLLDASAILAEKEGRFERSALLTGSADSLCIRLQIQRGDTEQQEHNRIVALLEEKLSRDLFAELYEEGKSMTEEEIFALGMDRTYMGQ